MATQQASNGYSAREHLVKISTKQGLKDYLPAAWRLYELTLKYPNANFSSEIVHLDAERDFCIVKSRLYLGPDYEISEKKVEAMKQGPLGQLDKLETAAKARCARDFGVSTEYALDIDEAVEDESKPATDEQLKRLRAYGAKLGYEDPGEGLTFEDADQLLREWYAEYQSKQEAEKREKAPLNGRNRPVVRNEVGVPMRV